jgi:hypothetical protein
VVWRVINLFKQKTVKKSRKLPNFSSNPNTNFSNTTSTLSLPTTSPNSSPRDKHKKKSSHFWSVLLAGIMTMHTKKILRSNLKAKKKQKIAKKNLSEDETVKEKNAENIPQSGNCVHTLGLKLKWTRSETFSPEMNQ